MTKNSIRCCHLSEFIGKEDNYIKNNIYSYILVDYKTLINNFDLLKYILRIKPISKINCLDYKSAEYIEQNINNKIDIILIDDYKNKDRSYIDTQFFRKSKFYLPLSYIMWNPNIDKECNVLSYLSKENISMSSSINGNKKVTKETLIRIKEIVESLNTSNLNDIDKCILISNYLQSKVQFKKDFGENHLSGKIETVINKNYGVCTGIASATTLLLNNPIFNVNVRNVCGTSHEWNAALIKGKNYFIDNTWNITRNPNKLSNILKASDFTDKYLLFGMDKLNSLESHDLKTYIPKDISDEDYNRIKIDKECKKLSKKIKLGSYHN